MKLYRIKDWDKLYEVSDSKKVEGPLNWVAVRTRTDGFGYLRITQQENRSDLLAAWYLMLGIAAKRPRNERGKLSRDGRPLTPEDMELLTRFPAKIFRNALIFFSNQEQGWLDSEETEDHPNQSDLIPIPSESSGSTVHTVQNKTKHTIAEPPAPRERDLLFDAIIEECKINPSEISPEVGKRVGKAIKRIKACSPNVTAEEIHRRATQYRETMPKLPVTPEAFPKHWPTLGAGSITPLRLPDNLLDRPEVP